MRATHDQDPRRLEGLCPTQLPHHVGGIYALVGPLLLGDEGDAKVHVQVVVLGKGECRLHDLLVVGLQGQSVAVGKGDGLVDQLEEAVHHPQADDESLAGLHGRELHGADLPLDVLDAVLHLVLHPQMVGEKRQASHGVGDAGVQDFRQVRHGQARRQPHPLARHGQVDGGRFRVPVEVQFPVVHGVTRRTLKVREHLERPAQRVDIS